MAGVIGTQDLWIAGSRFFFQPNWYAPNTTTTVSDRLIDMGVIDTASPTVQPTKIELRDGQSGIRKIIDTSLTDFSETYSITCRNFSRDNLNLMFFASAPIENVEEADTAPLMSFTTNTSIHTQGTIMQFVNNGTGGTPSNKPVLNLLSLGTITGGSTLACSIYDAAKGLIRIDTAPATNVAVTIPAASTNPDSATNNRNLMYPQMGNLTRFQGTGYMFWARNNGEYQDVREFTCQLLPDKINMSVDDYSTFSFTAKALYDTRSTAVAGLGGTSAPFGRLVKFLGSTI